jgi:23S rRNA pseudouridine2605 synthase
MPSDSKRPRSKPKISVPKERPSEAVGRMRIARALSVLGVASRREAERLIADGRVRCNDEVVTSPATIVELGRDRLQVADQVLSAAPTHRYVALNKPLGVVSTVWDPHADRTVIDLVPSTERLYPVGRLDKDSEGLILLTNDGDFTNQVTHPRYETEKEYFALVESAPTVPELRSLRTGVSLDGQRTAPARVRVEEETVEGTWIRITLHEGRNREVRRMLQAVGHDVLRLVRTRVGPIELGNLPSGKFRELRQEEVRKLLADARAAVSGNPKPARGERSGRSERSSSRPPRIERTDTRTSKPERPRRTEGSTPLERPTRPDRPARTERPARPDRTPRTESTEGVTGPDRPTRRVRPSRSQRIEYTERTGGPDRPPRADRTDGPHHEGRPPRKERSAPTDRPKRTERPTRTPGAPVSPRGARPKRP